MDRCSVWRCARGFGVGGRSACWWVPSVECGDRHLQACHLGPSGDHGLHNDGDTNFGIILQSATSEMVLRQNLLLACISDRRNPNSVKIINILTSQCLKALSSTLLTSLRISMIITFFVIEYHNWVNISQMSVTDGQNQCPIMIFDNKECDNH